jgi:hypothetical protein
MPDDPIKRFSDLNIYWFKLYLTIKYYYYLNEDNIQSLEPVYELVHPTGPCKSQAEGLGGQYQVLLCISPREHACHHGT